MYNYKGNIVSYDAKNREYRIVKAGKEVSYKPELAVIADYVPQDFLVKILYNQKAVENSIYQVCCDQSQRVGWLFPLQALCSNQHDYHDNEHFLRQAYVAYNIILEMLVDKIDFEKADEIVLTDYLNENCQILLLEKGLLDRENIIFTYQKYAPSFLYYGYTTQNFKFEFGRIAELEIKIRLNKVSSELEQDMYISTLFCDLIPSDLDELSRFHVLYQTIEVMINIIFRYLFKELLQQLESSTNDIYINETADKLKNLTGEKDRIRKLFHEWCRFESDIRSDLTNECKAFLDDNKYSVDNNDLFSYLYGTRNLIVHSMYKLGNEELKKLKGINERFLYALINMVNTFEKPTKDAGKQQG